ncbi:MAG: CBS domain-containing protein, partial [Candidatus Latescibacteria bacterium]|nr:CBS domain-containing protein [Candidatus Latescibacterota bacterium]
MANLKAYLVSPQSTMREILTVLEQNHKGIVLVTKPNHHLIGTITDGDVRRAALAGIDMDQTATTLLQNKDVIPVTAPDHTSDEDLLHLMNQFNFRQIPLVDKQGKVTDVALLSELVKEYEQPLKAIVMAGGYGTRLRPLTQDVPKPMLPVGDRPLLERLIEQLRASGIQKVNLTTHYKSDVIHEHFGDGHEFGVDIQYVEE